MCVSNGEFFEIDEYTPFREYIIHRRNPLRVNARGMIKSRSNNADVDSSSSSTIPTAYRTNNVSGCDGSQMNNDVLPKMKCAIASP
jgi:hypothetical protein